MRNSRNGRMLPLRGAMPLTIIVGMGVAMLAPLPVSAAEIMVDTLEDVLANDGACSLREAILNANGGDASGSDDCASGSSETNTIGFDPSLVGGTIVLNGTQLPMITQALVLEGPVSGNPTGITLDANGGSRIFEVSGDIVVSLQDLTLTGGHTTLPNAQGGAMRVVGAHLELTRVVVTGNLTERAGGHGGGVYVSGGSVALTDCVVSHNRAKTSVSNGGGVAAVGESVVLLNRSLVWFNQSDNNQGGGVYVDGKSELTLVNSTVSGNQGSSTGGLAALNSSVIITHSTLAFNTTDTGLSAQDLSVTGWYAADPAILVLNNSLVVQEEDSKQTCSAFNNTTTTISASLSTHGSCTGVATPQSAIKLGQLADNGGFSATHTLGLGSVAVDAGGDCATDFDVHVDQRGEPRPGGDSQACDLGALEVQEPPPEGDLSIINFVVPENADIQDTVIFTLVAANHGPDDAIDVVVTDHLPAGYDFVSASATQGVYDEISGLWNVGALASGADATLTIEVTVTAVHDYWNTASIGSPLFDDNLANNTAKARIYLPPATLVVNTLEDSLDDDGHCSLREAIINANNNDQSGSVDCAAGNDIDTITFAASLMGNTIVLGGAALPTISYPVNIEGPVTGDAGGITLDGNGESRILYINGISGPVTVRLQDLTLTGGRTTQDGAAAYITAGAHAEMTRVKISGNVVQANTGAGGGIRVGGGSGLGGSLLLVDSEISDNRVQGDAGTFPHGGGVAVYDGATVTVIRSTVSGNQAQRQGGGFYVRRSTVNLLNSTVSGNQAGSSGGGGGIYLDGGSATLTHTTLAFNTASTVAGNAQGIGFAGSAEFPSSVVLNNSLVLQSQANHVACAAANDHQTIINTASLSTHESCTGTATAAEDIYLGPLCHNGGYTRTHALAPTSVAIDAAGDCVEDFSIDEDQRGGPRPGGDSLVCDIGAYEVQSADEFLTECPDDSEADDEDDTTPDNDNGGDGDDTGDDDSNDSNGEVDDDETDPAQDDSHKGETVAGKGCGGCNQGTLRPSLALVLLFMFRGRRTKNLTEGGSGKGR